MNSFDYLRKLYKSSKSTVIIVNSVNTFFWAHNLELLDLTEEELRTAKATEYFDKMLCELYPGEYIANIKGTSYTYNVKTFSDRSNKYIIIEIRNESTISDFLGCNNVGKFLENTNQNLKINTANIVSIIDKLYKDKTAITSEEYQSIIQSLKLILGCNRNLTALRSIHKDINKTNKDRTNISEIASKFSTDCENIFKDKNIELSFDCVESIYAFINEDTFYNLCVAILNKALELSNGYIDKVTISLDMFKERIAEISITTESSSKIKRISDDTILNDIAEKGATLGTDLFFIKDFCISSNSEAIQKNNIQENTHTVAVRIPRCESGGITIIRCTDEAPEYVDRFSKLSIDLAEIMSLIK